MGHQEIPKGEISWTPMGDKYTEVAKPSPDCNISGGRREEGLLVHRVCLLQIHPS